ncbi:MAG: ribosome silencing factor [Candidatus Omnitrophica bacterium]|nr:ribosome silencing factor [Candidatus Omnitrophota bacterium]MCM8823159.1 ribosome silencing factor [Candidatus Omnitrophota bacterium]MCM8826324.1 ribosome silencing factor [Candidatus Omnitrophota bacterium]
MPRKLKERNLELDSKQKAFKIVEFVIGKKANKPIVLELKKLSRSFDYFVICSGDSERQVRAIYEEAIRLSKENRIDIHHIEDDVSSNWLLIDYFDVILHIFNQEARDYYNLEEVWSEAKRVGLPRKLFLEKTKNKV